MQKDPVSVARASCDAYVNKDRAAIDTLPADDFHFTGPVDHRLDRKTYFERCWSTNETMSGFDFIHLVTDGNRVFVTYEGRRVGGKGFRNTKIITVQGGKIVAVEVYWGWTIPHQAAEGDFVAS